jgi:hypothetical protein
VRFTGDKTLRDGIPKVFPVTIITLVEEPGIYEGTAEIVPIGQTQFETKEIELRLEAEARPSLLSVAQVGFILFLLVAIFLLAILVIRAGVGRRSMPKDIDPATINSNTFKLLDQVTGQQVEPLPLSGVVYDEPTKVATFIPANALENGRRYGATITSGVRDKSGNVLAQDHTWHFTTRPLDDDLPKD